MFIVLSATHVFASDRSEIKHVIVIMQENRSFDHYFSGLSKPEFYGSEVDVMDVKTPIATRRVKPPFLLYPYNIQTTQSDPPHGWRSTWRDYNNGEMNHFSRRAMGYYDERDLPFYYELANTYAISDRYFCSVLGPTYPNRSFLLAGTSFGFTGNVSYQRLQAHHITPVLILDTLDAAGRSWGYYTDGKAFVNKMFGPKYVKKSIAEFQSDLATGRLPDVVFLDAVLGRTDEHPRASPQIGSAWVKARVEEIQASAYWSESVVFLTYDEGGGFYDHVAPPRAVSPDGITPLYPASYGYTKYGWNFDRYGMRVPFTVISPFAKRHYVSHVVKDHTSVLRFIEDQFTLPSLGARDDQADNLMDMFDFSAPDPAASGK